MVTFAADLSIQLQKQWKQHKLQRIDGVEPFHVYRGLNLPESEVTRIETYRDKIITTKGFLSTTRSLLVARMFASNVIFDIEIDPNVQNIVYADISQYSHIPDEEEILIDFDTSFRVTDIIHGQDHVWIVNLVSVDRMADVIDAYIRMKQLQCEPDVMIANALLFFGHQDHTLRFLHQTIDSTDDYSKKFELNRKLGEIYAQSGNFISAIEVLEEANNFGLSLQLHENEFRSLRFLLAIMYGCSNEQAKAYDYLEIGLDFPNPQPYSLPRLTATDRVYLATHEQLLDFEPYEAAYNYLRQYTIVHDEDKAIVCIMHLYMGLITLKCRKEQEIDDRLDESLLHLKECGRLISDKWIDYVVHYYYSLGLIYESKNNYLAALNVYRNITYTLHRNNYTTKWILFVHVRIATCYKAMRKYPKAFQIYKQVIDQSLIVGDYMLVSKVRAHLGLAYREAKEYDEAIQQFLTISSLLNTTEEPFISEIFLIIAEIFIKNDDLENALMFYSRFLTNCYDNNDQHELWCDTCERVLLLHYSKNRFNESMIYAKKLLEYRMGNITDFDEQIVEAQLIVALCCMRNSAWNEAIDYYTMAWNTLTRISTSNFYKEYDLLISDRGLLIQATLAMLYRNICSYDQAISHAKIALKTEEKRLSRDKNIIGSCYDFIGWCYIRKRDYENALLFCNIGLSLLQTSNRDNETKYYHLYHSLAFVEFERGDLARSYFYCLKGIHNLVDKADLQEQQTFVPYFIALKSRIIQHKSTIPNISIVCAELDEIEHIDDQLWGTFSLTDGEINSIDIVCDFDNLHNIILPHFPDPNHIIYSMLMK